MWFFHVGSYCLLKYSLIEKLSKAVETLLLVICFSSKMIILYELLCAKDVPTLWYVVLFSNCLCHSQWSLNVLISSTIMIGMYLNSFSLGAVLFSVLKKYLPYAYIMLKRQLLSFDITLDICCIFVMLHPLHLR